MPLVTEDFTVGSDSQLSSLTGWNASYNDMDVWAATDDCTGGTASQTNGCYYDGTFAADQYSQVEYSNVTADSAKLPGPAVRMDGSGNFYLYCMNTTGQSLYKVTAGTESTLDVSGVTNVAGNVAYLEAIGTSGIELQCRLNGLNTLYDNSDSSFTSGSVGVGAYGGNDSAATRIDNFRGSDFTGTDKVKILQTRVAADTGGGLQRVSFSGLSDLTPKAALVFYTRATADDTVTAGGSLGIGASMGMVATSNSQKTHGFYQEDNVTPTDHNFWDAGEITIQFVDSAAGDDGAAALYFGPDEVYLQWTTTPGAAYLLTIVVFAGTDLQVFSEYDTALAATDNTTTAVTVGFKSDLIISIPSAQNGGISTGTSDLVLGFAIPPTNPLGYGYDFDTGTGSGPASGEIRLNNATFSSATVMYVHDTDRGSTDRDADLDAVAVGDRIELYSEVDAGRLLYEVTSNTDSGTYHTFGVTFLNETPDAGAGFTDTEDITIVTLPYQHGVMVYDRTSRDPSEHHGGISPLSAKAEPITTTPNWYNWQIEDIDSTSFDWRNTGGDRTGRAYWVLCMNFGADFKASHWQYTTPSSTGNDTDEGPGFEPQWVFYTGLLTANIGDYSFADTPGLGGSRILASITSSNQYSHNAVGQDNLSADSNTASIVDDQSVNILEEDQTVGAEATFVEFTSLGVTNNWTDVSAGALAWIGIAVEAAAVAGTPLIDKTIYGGRQVLTPRSRL